MIKLKLNRRMCVLNAKVQNWVHLLVLKYLAAKWNVRLANNRLFRICFGFGLIVLIKWAERPQAKYELEDIMYWLDVLELKQKILWKNLRYLDKKLLHTLFTEATPQKSTISITLTNYSIQLCILEKMIHTASYLYLNHWNP